MDGSIEINYRIQMWVGADAAGQPVQEETRWVPLLLWKDGVRGRRSDGGTASTAAAARVRIISKR
jgi:hypothetical protein